MGLRVRGRAWRDSRERAVRRTRGEVHERRAWRWLCAAPWLGTAGLFLLQWAWGFAFGYWGVSETVVFVLLFLITPVVIAALIVVAPRGGWLILVGLGASVAGLLLVALVASYLALEGSMGAGRPTAGGVVLAIACIPLVSGVAVLLFGILDTGPERPADDRVRD